MRFMRVQPLARAHRVDCEPRRMLPNRTYLPA